MRLLSALLLLPFLCLAAPAGAAPIPALLSPLTDETGLLTQEDAAALDQKLRRFADESGSQIAALIVPTTDSEDIFT